MAAADGIPRMSMAALGADPAAFARAMAETGFVVLTDIGEGEKLHRDMMADFAAFMASRYRCTARLLRACERCPHCSPCIPPRPLPPPFPRPPAAKTRSSGRRAARCTKMSATCPCGTAATRASRCGKRFGCAAGSPTSGAGLPNGIASAGWRSRPSCSTSAINAWASCSRRRFGCVAPAAAADVALCSPFLSHACGH